MKRIWQALTIFAVFIGFTAGAVPLREAQIFAADTPAAPLQPVIPQPENGTGAEAGVYAPPLSGPRGQVNGTIENGAGGYYVVTYDQQGHTKYYRGKTDAAGRYAFAVPAAAAAFMVFRHFDSSGKPDAGARCDVSNDAAVRIAGTRTVNAGPQQSPEIVAANSAYQRGQIVDIQTHGSNARAALLIDGDPAQADTLASSDRSVVARIKADASLGRHQLSVQYGAKRSAPVPAYLIDASLSASGSNETGGIQVATLSVTGLSGSETAVVDFDVSGSAELAVGGSHTTVPLAGNEAHVRVRGVRAGQAIVHWHLRVDMPPYYNEQVAEVTPTPYPYYTTSRPPKTPTPRPTATPSPGENGNHTTGRDTQTPPPTDVRPTPERSPTAPPSEPPTPPPPSSSPSASPSPTPTPCSYQMKDGWFEPAQGVWQDDPFFPNMPGKQLTRLHDLDPVPHYDAELDMVEGRDTVLFGVNHYEDHGRVQVNSRNTIVLAFDTNCTEQRAARVMFQVKERGSERDIVAPQVFMIPIDGPRSADGQMHTFTVRLPAAPGIPANPFTMNEGGYTINGELVTMNGEHTGLMVVVDGRTVITHPPALHFVPMRLFSGANPPPAAAPGQPSDALTPLLLQKTEALRADSAAVIPDYYPIAPNSLPTVRERLFWVSQDQLADNGWWSAGKYVGGQAVSGIANFFGSNYTDDDVEVFTNQSVVARLTAGLANYAGFAGFMNGANRMVLVFTPFDYKTIVGSFKIQSFNLGNKAILTYAAVNADAIAHEVAHSIPPPNWDPNPTCNLPYHNTGITGTTADPYGTGTTANGYAAGERLRKAGVRTRVLTDGTIHIMGGFIDPASVPKRVWAYTTQCTYWHLLNNMLEPPDPRVILVRAFIGKRGGKYAASFQPAYDLDGVASLSAGTKGSWAIIARDAGGREIARYRFEPSWSDENGAAREVLALAYTIPGDERIARIEIQKPDRQVQTMIRSTSPPTVTLDAPVVRGNRATVRWHPHTQSGFPGIATIFVSDDGGKTYRLEAIETTATTSAVTFSTRAHRHRLKLVLSDYTRSVETTVDFRS